VIDYTEEDYKDVANNLDLVFDTLGDSYAFEAFDCIKEGGVVTSIAGPPSEETAKQMGIEGYQLPEKLSKRIQAKSAGYKFTWMQPDAEQLNEITALVEDGQIKPIVDLIYNFEDSVEAYENLATGRAKGKIIISLS
jgi:NADPH:quinone reductase-like Zn-dependent oxidoreductase